MVPQFCFPGTSCVLATMVTGYTIVLALLPAAIRRNYPYVYQIDISGLILLIISSLVECIAALTTHEPLWIISSILEIIGVICLLIHAKKSHVYELYKDIQTHTLIIPGNETTMTTIVKPAPFWIACLGCMALTLGGTAEYLTALHYDFDVGTSSSSDFARSIGRGAEMEIAGGILLFISYIIIASRYNQSRNTTTNMLDVIAVYFCFAFGGTIELVTSFCEIERNPWWITAGFIDCFGMLFICYATLAEQLDIASSSSIK